MSTDELIPPQFAATRMTDKATLTAYEPQPTRTGMVLRESEDLFRAAFESSIVGFAILRLDTTFVHVNEAFCSITGFSRDELSPMPFTSLTHPDDVAHADALIAQVRSRERQALVVETRCLRKDGALIWVQNSVSSTSDADGHPRNLVVICQDVTERRHASQMKDDFLATLSHELRTPLNAVLGWAQMLRSGGLRPDATQKGLEALERNAKAQARLVDELLDLSRIITGKLQVGSEPVSLGRVIANAVEAIRPAATKKRLSLYVRADSNIEHVVRGDAIRLQQVVWNLLSNAVKFTPSQGAIDIELRRDGGDAIIRVTDTGQGIGAELLPFVFDRFRQGDASTTRHHGGLGLGLAIVRHLTEAHGGSVTAQSGGTGCGAAFTIRLPLVDTPLVVTLSLSPTTRRLSNDSLRGVRVLVVDDMPDARELMRAALESVGAEVTAATTAAEVLALVEHNGFDLLVADVGMPDQDGYSLVETLRQRPAHRGGNIRAVALTAYAGIADRDRALAAGFDLHLAKPLDPTALIEAVADVLAAGPA